MMKNLMLDLETMGVGTDAAMLSLSAVQFDIATGDLGQVFDLSIDLQSCFDHGLKPSASTILWWLAQSQEARKAIIDGQNEAKWGKEARSLTGVLLSFNRYLIMCADEAGCKVEDLELWGNSAKFDLSPLENGYKRCGMDIPWNPFKERCYRTMDAQRPHIRKNLPFVGTKHKGVDDSIHQIKALVLINRELNPTYEERMIVPLSPHPHEQE